MNALPDDVITDILVLLPPRSLAASRCVYKSWRAIVDDHQLLLPPPRSVLENKQRWRRAYLAADPSPVSAALRVRGVGAAA